MSFTIALHGMAGYVVRVDTTRTPRGELRILGLENDAAERETRVRVRAALRHLNVELEGGFQVVLKCATSVPLVGPFDLAIAVSILEALDNVPACGGIHDEALLGELSLSGGEVRPVRGVLPSLLGVPFKAAVVPHSQALEAAESSVHIFGAQSLADVVAHLRGECALSATARLCDERWSESLPKFGEDVSTFPGGTELREAIAGRPVLLVGPPGLNAWRYAHSVAESSPWTSRDEATIATAIHSAAGLLSEHAAGALRCRPVRAPHHTVSDAGLCGGGTQHARPGEVSLAHGGVLLLDEVNEFRRTALECLKSTLKSEVARVGAGRFQVTFPAKPMAVIMTAHACPCGWRRDAHRVCRCTPESIQRHEKRLGEICKMFGAVRNDIHVPRVATTEQAP